MDVLATARAYAEHKAQQVKDPGVEINMAIEVWTVMAVEVLEFAQQLGGEL